MCNVLRRAVVSLQDVMFRFQTWLRYVPTCKEVLCLSLRYYVIPVREDANDDTLTCVSMKETWGHFVSF